MNINEFKNLLLKMEIPIAFWEFSEPTSAPCICYIVNDTSSTFANSARVKKNLNVRVELYTKRNDYSTNKKFEKLLDDNDILYEVSSVYVSERKEVLRYYDIVLEEE